MQNLPEKTGASSLPVSLEQTLNGSVERFLLSLDITPGSKETYRRALGRFVEWVGERGIGQPTREDILAYKGFLGGRGLSPLTVSGYLVPVRRFFEWAEGMKIYPNVARGIRGAKRSQAFMKDPLTVDQVKALLGDIERDGEGGERDFALLNLLIRTGLRTIEVARADVGDIRQEGGEAVLWVRSKGRDAKDEFVLLTEETLKPIRDYLQARGKIEGAEPLFASVSDRNRERRLTTRSIRRIVKQHLVGVGLISGRLTAHSLRHTAITLALQGGATIQEAQALGRHANINTTLVYAHNIDRLLHAPERRIDEVLAGV